MEKYTSILKKKAVYNLLIERLSEYLDSDVAKASSVIQFKHDDLNLAVDQGTLEDVRGELTEVVEALTSDLKDVEED